MAQTILVTSGKGGVGKSSSCVFLGYSLASQGKRVLIVELDAGLRGLDIMLGVENKTVYDMGDILLGRCDPYDAVVSSDYQQGLSLLPAPTDHWEELQQGDILWLIKAIADYYDYILMDSPAGFGKGFRIGAAAAELALLVVTPDPVCVRDGYLASVALEQRGVKRQRLLINRVRQQYVKSELPDLDTVIDQTGVQLIGVVPEDIWVMKAASRGVPLPSGSKALPAYQNIAKRLLGQYCPLAVG